MEQCPLASPQCDAILRVLEAYDQASLAYVDLHTLAISIQPYVQRSRLPLIDAVPKIAKYYLQYGAVVKRLLASPETPEWHSVLEWVVEYATRHALYPRDTEAVSAPDLDAYDEIRRKLGSYNFEGTLESWLTAVVVSRLRRYWRDQQTLAAGGNGIKTKAERASHEHTARRAPNASLMSLDQLMNRDDGWKGAPPAQDATTTEIIEGTELCALVLHELRALALKKKDPLVLPIWHAIVERGLKLRETADGLGLTVAQVHRRVALARHHLRQSPHIRHWRDAHLL
jgi:DNA-directed RNA polymerase specialized sigma24 family protein